MSRQEKLSKKIAHTLLAMTIVYSGGMNVACNTTFAANGADGVDGVSITKSVDISAGISKTYTGTAGAAGGEGSDGGSGGNGGHGGSVTVNDTVTGSVGGAINITATGGTGALGGSGRGNVSYERDKGPSGANGRGGDSTVVIAVAGDSMETSNNITVTVKAGAGCANSNDIQNENFLAIDGAAGGKALAIGLQADNKNSLATITAADITISATGGAGGQGSSSYNNGAVGGIGGAAEAYGLSAASSLLTLTVNDITATAIGGKSGDGGRGGYVAISENKIGGSSGEAGIAEAVGVRSENSKLQGTINSITITAVGGEAGATGKSGSLTVSPVGSAGAKAYAFGIQEVGNSNEINLTVKANITAESTGGVGGISGYNSINGISGNGGMAIASGVWADENNSAVITAANIIITATGGQGGSTESSYGDSVAGGIGGAAEAYGISAVNSMVAVTANKIQVRASGGAGGDIELNPRFGGSSDSKFLGSDGGKAIATGIRSDKKLGSMDITAAEIIILATGGQGGKGSSSYAGGGGGIGGAAEAYGNNGTAGTIGAEAKAYGIYAERNAVIDLHAKAANGTIKIGAKANNADSREAYAVYADNATVLFHDNATLNTSDGATTVDNNVITSLNNATLGFGGTAANRTVTGGTLQLTGSNTFMVNTDLVNGTADKFTFDSLAADNSTDKQYITVGYDAAIDPYKVGSVEASGGAIDVLEITSLASGQSLENFTGGTTTLDSVLYQFNTTADVQLDDSGKKVQLTGVTVTKTPAPSESVKTASDAQMALGSLWRMEGNNLMKRMGELRSDKEAAQGGVWARYYRGEMSADSAYGREFSQDYTAFQGGIDKVQDYKGGKLYTGIAVNRIDSNAGYNAGSGDMSSTGVGLYASWLGSKGHYVDVIARGSKLANDFKLVDLSGNAAKADYDTWAYGISAEYGYRQNLKAGWFVEPQAELSLGHINSADYEMSNGARIETDSVNSAVTRLGVLGGKEFSISGRPGNAYVKASLLHDFGGNGGATGYYQNDSLALQTGDLTGTWYEVGLGANLGIAKNGNLYFDALKTFNGNLRTDWQINAGLRFTF